MGDVIALHSQGEMPLNELVQLSRRNQNVMASLLAAEQPIGGSVNDRAHLVDRHAARLRNLARRATARPFLKDLRGNGIVGIVDHLDAFGASARSRSIAAEIASDVALLRRRRNGVSQRHSLMLRRRFTIFTPRSV
jgi:hypothetical protein